MSGQLDMSKYESEGKITNENVELNVIKVGEKFHATVLVDDEEYGRGVADVKLEAVQMAIRAMRKELAAQMDRMLDSYNRMKP